MRPLTIGEILDQAFRLYRKNFLTFLGIVALIYIPFSPLNALLSYFMTASLTNRAPSPFLPIQYWISFIGTMILAVTQFMVVGVALSRAIAMTYAGHSISVTDAFRQMGKTWFRVPGVVAIYFILTLLAGIWMLIPCVGWLSGLGILLYLGIAIMPLLAPIMSLEKQGALATFRRAWDLARARFWWLVGFVLLLTILSWIIVNGPVILVSSVLNLILESQIGTGAQTVWTVIVQALVQVIGSVLYLPLQMGAMTVLYFDLRVRFEGLDIALQASADSGVETNIVTLAETLPQPNPTLITGTEIGYFVLLTLAFIAVYTIIVGIIFGLGLLMVAGL